MIGIFTYEKQSDGTLRLTGCSGAAAIVVPEVIDGCKVTGIAQNAFGADAEKIFLPKSIQQIEEGAFAACPRANLYCASLYAYGWAQEHGLYHGYLSVWDENQIRQIIERVPNVYICEPYHYTLNERGEAVIVKWLGAHGGDALAMPDELDGYTVSAIFKTVFRDLLFRRIVLPSHLREIGDHAFEGCAWLEEVVFPQTLENIGAQAFKNCTQLRSVDLPNGVVHIGSEAFCGCESLASALIRSRTLSFGHNVFAGWRRAFELAVREGSSALDYAKQNHIPYVILLEGDDNHSTTQEEQTMKDPNCGYCMHGELLAAYGIYMCDLSVSKLYLFKEQSHPGRCIVAYNDHISEIVNLTDEERNAFFADVNRAAKAIHAAYHPDKLNYGAYGDTGCHLHFHLVPKYRDGFEWGGTFAMNPGEVKLTDAEYEEMIEKIKAHL